MTPYNNLLRAIDSMVHEKATKTPDGYILSVDELDDHELGNLAALCLEYDERDTTDCFHQSHKNNMEDEITCALLNLLKVGSNRSIESIAILIRDNTINKYKPFIQKLIDEACDLHYQTIWDKYA